MKTLKLIFVFALLMHIPAIAQSYQENVYLKNGSIIKGVVLEQVPNKSIKVQTSDGSIYVYKMSEVEKITKDLQETNESKPNKVKSKDSRSSVPAFLKGDNGLKKGYRKFIDAGVSLNSDNHHDAVFVETTHGFQLNKVLFVGVGIGFHYYWDDSYYIYEPHSYSPIDDKYKVYIVPLFADVRFDFMNNRLSPFVDIRGGYSIIENGEAEGAFFSVGPGVRYKLNDRKALNLCLGYMFRSFDDEGRISNVFARISFEF